MKCPLVLLAFSVFCISLPTVLAGEAKPVLVVLSGGHALKLKDGKIYPTGFYLNELAVPLRAVIDAGFRPIIATPSGSIPSLDAASDSKKYFHDDEKEYLAAKKLVADLGVLTAKPRSLASFTDEEIARFAGVFVPGGHAPMIDLHQSPEFGRILRRMHVLARPTAMICHGPVALLSARSDADTWIYRGYHLTVFSDAEEKSVEAKLGGPLAFNPEDALHDAGAKVENGPGGKSHIVEDRELITGQNPASDAEFARAFVRKLAVATPIVAQAPIDPSTSGFYQRLYEGYTAVPIEAHAFEAKMNAEFFPLFDRAASEGLVAYRPLLPRRLPKCVLPNEIALLTFEKEATYQKYKTSPIGKEIVRAHGTVFNPKTSASHILVPFQGKVEKDHAYALNPLFQDYRQAPSAVAIFCGLKSGVPETLNGLAAIYAKPLGVAAVVPVFSGDHVVEFVFGKADPSSLNQYFTAQKQNLGALFRESEFIVLPKHPIGKPPVHTGTGVDAVLH
jgi:putative intracellular protease/amidase